MIKPLFKAQIKFKRMVYPKMKSELSPIIHSHFLPNSQNI